MDPTFTTDPKRDELDTDLSTRELRANLKHTSTRSGAVMIVSHAIQLGIGVTGTAILARMLRPQDFGYLAMVASLTNFVATFRDFGLPMAAVHKETLSHEQASGLFWFNLLASFVVAALVAAMAWPLAWFYSEPRLVGMTLVMSAGILVSSSGMVHVGLLRRNMRFTSIATLEIAAMLVGLVVGVCSAFAGAGYWALVYQQITIYLTQTSLALILSRWKPAPRHRSATLADPGLRAMLHYGRNVSSTRIVTYLGRNTDSVLVGYFAGPATLGLYQKAYQWSITPFWQIFSPLMPVAVASFSRLQAEPERYRAYVRTAMLGLFSLTLPATMLLILAAEPVVLLLLGSQWTGAISLFRILAAGAYFSGFSMVTRWLFLAEGRTAEELRFAMIAAPITILGVVAGLPWGATGVAAGFSITTSALTIPGLMYCLRRSPVRARDFVASTWRPLVASLLAAGAAWLIRERLPTPPRLIGAFLLDCAIYVPLYALTWLALPNGLAEAARMLRHLRPARPT